MEYTNNIAELCKDYDLKSIIETSKETNRWNRKFEKYDIAKQGFESLRIVKKSKKLLED